MSNDNGKEASRELVLERLKQHVKVVCDRYKDIVYAWDVVNEAIEDKSEMLSLQAKVYDDIFSVFKEYKEFITSVTFWGISDRYTWKDNFPVRGRKDWPMLM
ncbi:endo-1,4-beta-xylanase [Clostridium oryzae]|uniref:Endo-1,4-beta-xylanase A n=1 Tax=Clostridium oryzae TaxID=1450648 RepID=A0A1V4IHN5_9CLOT|nr:endo-1,4-beta-xylanase [Clostridium oryzae]OPJ59439.1 endo-1,4-beta-xylanase A [Clostridium oryzae]